MNSFSPFVLPILVAIVFLRFCISMFDPQPIMIAFLWLALFLALATTGALAVTLSRRTRQRLSIARCVTVSAILYLIWMLYWATSEEIYILTLTDHSIMGRYIYPGHSGDGFADGFGHVFGNCLKMILFGSVVGFGSWVCLALIQKAREVEHEEPGYDPE